MMIIRPIEKKDLQYVLDLTDSEGWPSYVKNPERAWRVLTAPGVISLVAVLNETIVGFVQMQSDGAIQAHLSNILVEKAHRRQGIGKKLVEEAFKISGAERIDLITQDAPEFYRSFAHYEWHGFRLHPQFNKDGSPNQQIEIDRKN